MDRVTNVQVLERILEGPLLWKNIEKQRRNEWIGHTMGHEGLFKLIIEKRVKGINRRGIPKLEYIK